MATTIEKYLTEIIGATQETGIYAYRGQSDSHWALHSSATVRLMDQYGDDILLDPDFQELYINYHVETLIEPARALGFGSESGRRLSDLELLAKLQHFGARTGLLDFTRNPLVALWFACERPETDGKLVVVNTNDPMGISRISSEEAVQDVRNVFSRPPRPPHFSYWETPASGDASTRILPQRSVFVIGRPLGLISEAKLCYEQAIQSGISHVGIHQNTWTLDKMVPLIDGLNYGLSAEPDPGTGAMCLRFTLPETATEVGREIERSIFFFGRAGNVGNTGGPGLSGGLGFQGKPFVRVYAEFRSEHGT